MTKKLTQRSTRAAGEGRREGREARECARRNEKTKRAQTVGVERKACRQGPKRNVWVESKILGKGENPRLRKTA